MDIPKDSASEREFEELLMAAAGSAIWAKPIPISREAKGSGPGKMASKKRKGTTMNKKLLTRCGALALLLAGASLARAQSSAGGSGGAYGVTVGCGSASNTVQQNVSACGSSSISQSGTSYSLSGPMTLNVLTSNSTVEGFTGDDLTPGAEPLSFNFNFDSSTGTGTFSLLDAYSMSSETGIDFSLSGNVTALKASGTSSVGQWVLTLVPTLVGICPPSSCTGDYAYIQQQSLAGSGITATMAINYDPGKVTGAFAGLSGGPFGTGGSGSSPTPEPGTLLLLGSGLMGLAPLIRRGWKA